MWLFLSFSFIATPKQAGLVSKVPDSSLSQNPLKSLVVKRRQLFGLFSFTRANVHSIIIPFTEKKKQCNHKHIQKLQIEVHFCFLITTFSFVAVRAEIRLIWNTWSKITG